MINDDSYNGYDSLVGSEFQREIDYLSEEHELTALSALNSIVEQGLETSLGVKIATIYDRKGYINHDKITGPRNPEHASDHDDIILQITIRVDGRQIKSKSHGFEELSDFIDRLRDEHREVEIKKVEKELSATEAVRNRLEAEILEKKSKLEALRNNS